MSKIDLHTGYRAFLDSLSQLSNPKELQSFLEVVLTQEERDAIGKRILIIKGLLEGKHSQRELAEQLKVSISKITRGSNSLKLLDERYKNSLKQLLS